MFRLAFQYDAQVVSLVKALPSAAFDPETKRGPLASASRPRDELSRLHLMGMVDVSPDTLVDPSTLPTLAPATIRRGTSKARPYIVQMAKRDDLLYKSSVY